jgi:hypothetical protein
MSLALSGTGGFKFEAALGGFGLGKKERREEKQVLSNPISRSG